MMISQQATYQRQRDSFTAAMQRDGWTAVTDIFGGTMGWAHETDSGWVVGDRLAFEHYIVNRMTPAVDLPLPF